MVGTIWKTFACIDHRKGKLMTEEKTKELAEKYPEILKNLGGDPSKTCMSDMHGGIAVDDGWFDLLDSVMGWCQFHTEKNRYPQLVADQIKEKFGTLRFYYHFEENSEYEEFKKNVVEERYAHRSEKYLEGALDFAQHISGKICEECGAPGSQTKTRWVKTLCPTCKKKYNVE